MVNPPPEEGQRDIGQAMMNALRSRLFDSRVFDIVNREVFEQAAEEINLGEFGLASDQFLEFGDITQASTFITGSIDMAEDGLGIVVTFTDIATQEVVHIGEETAASASLSDLRDAAQRIVDGALPKFPLIGRIFRITSTAVSIDRGTNDGLRLEDAGRVGEIFRVTETAGLVDTQTIGTFTISRVLASGSLIEVEMFGENELMEGDRVRIQLVGQAINTGTLRILGGPVGAEVFINEESQGVLPEDGLALNLPAGTTTLEVRAENHTPKSYSVNVTANQETPLHITLEPAPGNLTITTNVPAIVTLDGQEIGTTPINDLEITVGEHLLTIAAEGYEPRQTTITINPGQPHRESFELNAIQATLVLSITPDSAEVRIDGKLETRREIELPPGEHTVTVQADGYREASSTVDLAAQQRQELTVALEPAPGIVTITTNVPAIVTLDGQEIGTTPINDQEIAVGEHRITLEADGYEPRQTTITITPGQLLERRYTLDLRLATLVLTITPESAEVRIDGVLQSEREIALEPGPHELTISAEGYTPQQTIITLEPGQTVPQQVALETVVAMGGMSITTSPVTATAMLDGNVIGQTPFADLEIPEGEYQLQLEAEGYEPVERTVTIVAGRIRDISVEFSPTPEPTPLPALVALAISETQYEVFVDGESQGQATQLSLQSGSHTILVTAPGAAPLTFTLEVGPGEQVTRTITLEPLLATLILTVMPEDAEVSIDGVIQTEREVELTPGEHTVVVQADGYREASSTIDLDPGVRQDFRVTLEALAVALEVPPDDTATQETEDVVAAAKHGILQIRSNLPNIRIVLTDPFDQTATTTIEVPEQNGEAELPVGFYDVRASAPQARSIPDFVDIREGTTTELLLSFQTVDFTILGGVGNNEGNLELLLFAEYSGREITGPINITGPAGWNEDQPFTANLGGESYKWFAGTPVIAGQYTASFTETGVGDLFTVFDIGTGDYLEPAGVVAAETENGRTVSVSWSSRDEAMGYRMSIEDRSGRVHASEATQATSVTVNGLSLERGGSYLACVTAFTWPVSGTGMADQELLASRTCAPMVVPVQAQNQTDGNGPVEPDPCQPPPLRPTPECPDSPESRSPDTLDGSDGLPPIEVPNHLMGPVEYRAQFGSHNGRTKERDVRAHEIR